MSERILIAGWPRAGKTSLAKEIASSGSYPLVWHADDLNKTHSWSDQSLEAAAWIDAKGPWIIEGVVVVRAIRKWLARVSPYEKPAEVVYWADVPLETLTVNQRRLADGCSTIWKEVRPQLMVRGVQIRDVGVRT